MAERVGVAHMATLVARPDIFEFLENLSVHGKAPTNLDEIVCSNMAKSLQGKNRCQHYPVCLFRLNIYCKYAGSYILTHRGIFYFS